MKYNTFVNFLKHAQNRAWSQSTVQHYTRFLDYSASYVCLGFEVAAWMDTKHSVRLDQPISSHAVFTKYTRSWERQNIGGQITKTIYR